MLGCKGLTGSFFNQARCVFSSLSLQVGLTGRFLNQARHVFSSLSLQVTRQGDFSAFFLALVLTPPPPFTTMIDSFINSPL